MKSKSTQPEPDSLFFSPAKLGQLYVQYGEKIQTEGGITWGVTSMDKSVIPLLPGQLAFIVARPGHGKSTTAAYLAKRTARKILENGDTKHCVVYISFDQPVEEIYAMLQADAAHKLDDYAWGRIPIDKLKRKAIQAVDIPIWLIGRSVLERRAPRLTFPNIYNALAEMESKFRILPSLVVIDYIQIVPIEHKQNRTEQVGEAVIQARELAVKLASPMLILAQASRAVDSYEEKIPGLADCQHASAIEQDADKVFGVWRPCLTEQDETLAVRVNGVDKEIPIDANLFVVRMNKQRMGESGRKYTYYMRLDPSLVKLSDLELQAEERKNEFRYPDA